MPSSSYERNLAILVTGSRNVDRSHWIPIVRQSLDAMTYEVDRVIVLHGNCPNPSGSTRLASIDQIAHYWASLRLGFVSLPMSALWDKHNSKAAGPIRNSAMVSTMRGLMLSGIWQTEVIGFHPDIFQGRGTRDTLNKALIAGLDVYLNDGTKTIPVTEPLI